MASRTLAGIGSSLLLATLCLAQKPQAEVSAGKAEVVFQSATNLVPVPVVVRDSAGHGVGSLTADDFQLFDNGKPQTVSKFVVEKLATATQRASTPVANPAANAVEQPANPLPDDIPTRFVAYLFDDLHMDFSELHYTREAVRRQIDSHAHGTERAAIYTTSGQQMLEFSNDLEKLHTTLNAIGTGRASAAVTRQESGCPPMTFYMADLIINKSDNAALAIAVRDAVICAGARPDTAVQMANAAARDALTTGDQDAATSLETLRNVVARLASMPGQRTIVLISSGFLVLDNRRDEQTAIIDRAIRSNVIVGALDARGLSTNGLGDASQPKTSVESMVAKASYARTAAIVQSDILASVADGTGGVFYKGTNDYDEGVARTAGAPDFVYVLSFSPLNLKFDGKYHELKVALKNGKGLEIQARRGYFAPRHATDPAEQTRQEIQEAFFSNEEVRGLPVRMMAEFFKDGDNATLTVTARVDPSRLPFRKDEGRNRDDLTMVVGIFDQNGNFISAWQKIIQLRLRDETLSAWSKTGIENATDFTLRPGKYLVRMVMRDAEGASMAEQSTGVEIPY